MKLCANMDDCEKEILTSNVTTQTRVLSPTTWLHLTKSPTKSRPKVMTDRTGLERCLISVVCMTMFVILVLLGVLATIFFMFGGVDRHVNRVASGSKLSHHKVPQHRIQRPDIPIVEDNSIGANPSVNNTLLHVLGSKMDAKVKEISRSFNERFPRDGSRHRRRQYVPRRKEHVDEIAHYLGDDPQTGLTDREKIEELLFSLDENEDGLAGPWEIHDWILWVEAVYHQHVVDDQWHDIVGYRDKISISWPEYRAKVSPFGIKSVAEKKQESRERRRWNHADNDGNGRLDKREWKWFLFPHLLEPSSHLMIMEAHEGLDEDYDGRVSEDEFVKAHYQR